MMIHYEPMKFPVAIQIACIAVLCALIYGGSLGNGFIWDDDDYVYRNELVQKIDGLGSIWLANKTPQYYPVTFTAFWIGHKLWGLNPFWYHLASLVLHILNAALLFFVVRRLFFPAAFLTALIFAVHPIQVETVAWITETKNLLSMFFFLWAVLWYLKFDRTKKYAAYAATLCFFILALLSKSVAVCFAVVPVLYKWWKDGKVTAAEAYYSIPFFVLGFISGITTIFLELHRVGAHGPAFTLLPLERFILAGRALFFYIYKVCLPFQFIFFYPRWQLDVFALWQWLFPAMAVGLFVLLYECRRTVGRGAFALFLFYIVAIFPALGFFNVYPMVYSFVADHFSYIAMPALLLFLCGGIMMGMKKVSDILKEKGIDEGTFKACCAAVLAIVVILLSLKAAGVWKGYKDQITLWEGVVKNNPGSADAYINLGKQYYEAKRVREAVVMYRIAIGLNPDDFVAHYNLGNAYLDLGKYDEAVSAFTKALELAPGFPDIYNNLGMVYFLLHDDRNALLLYAEALAIDPWHENAIANIKLLFDRDGDWLTSEAAAGEFADEIGLLHELGVGQGKIRNIDNAILLLLMVAELDPQRAEAYNDLGYAYFKKDDVKKAEEYFVKALELDPGHEKARANLQALRSR